MTLMGSDRATWRNVIYWLQLTFITDAPPDSLPSIQSLHISTSFHCIFYCVYIFIHFPQVTWKKRFESRCHSIHTNPFAFQTKKTHKKRFRISLRSSKDPSVGFFTNPPLYIHGLLIFVCYSR
ncbi:hypothetical protein L1887_00725 [Cichorium endivia]|nr:hypothetical protein L1887_00725 [Cichorium endivia]